MRPTTTLLWKEWHAARAYLGIGLGVFLGLPAVGGLEDLFFGRHRFGLSASPWVLGLGGVLAVLAGVGVTTPDLRPKLDDFWRSRPIGVRRWIAAKYAVGLAAVLVACTVPLAAEAAAAPHEAWVDLDLLQVMPFFWAAVYSLAFLAGCVVPRPAHAATLGLTALLLVYVLPVVLPPLAWLDVSDVQVGLELKGLWTAPPLAFVGGMVGLSAVAAAVAVAGVARAWRVEAGRRVLFAGVGGSLLLLFASAAFQLGTNLPILQQVSLPPDERVRTLAIEGTSGYVITAQSPEFVRPQFYHLGWHFRSRPVDVTPAGLVLGPATDLTDDADNSELRGWDAVRGGFGYRIGSDPTGTDDVNWTPCLVTDAADPGRGGHATRLKLWQEERGDGGARLFLWGDTLYVYGKRLDVIDVSRPGQPRVVSDVADVPFIPPPWVGLEPLHGDHPTLKLLPLPGLPPEARLSATVAAVFRRAAFDGHTLCDRTAEFSPPLTAYRLTGLTADAATFDRVGDFTPTLLQRLADPYLGRCDMTISDGLIYLGGFDTDRGFNSAVSVLDTRGRRPMRMAGHFAAPGAQIVHPLPDGRAVVAGGNHLWLVGGPPGRGGD